MKTLVLAGAALALLLSAPVLAQPPSRTLAPPAVPLLKSEVTPEGYINLAPGRRLVVKLEEGKPVLVSEGPGDMSQFSPAAKPDPNLETFTSRPSPWTMTARPGEFVFTMRVASDGTQVVAENGTDQTMVYVAIEALTIDGSFERAPTTICAIGPGRYRVEQWGEKMDALQILQIGQAPAGSCYDPASRSFYREGTQPPSASTPPPNT